MKYSLNILLFLICIRCYSQAQYLSIGSDGELIVGTITGCCQRSLGVYHAYMDIAVTPNGTIYGIHGAISEINTSTGTSTWICSPKGFSAGDGAGLEALDNNYLVSDLDDSLILIEISTGKTTNLGYIGYQCSGDIAFLNGKLYMSATSSLVEISLDPTTHFITNISNIGSMKWDVWSLFTAFESGSSSKKSLFAISGDFLVSVVDTLNANLMNTCKLGEAHSSYGAASVSGFNVSTWDPATPNVFTPNGDGMNDVFKIGCVNSALDYQLTIYNRYGVQMFYSTLYGQHWDGYTSAGIQATAGVYYYTVYSNGAIVTGSITLLR